MIHELVKIRCRYPPGTCLSTKLPHFRSCLDDHALEFSMNDCLIAIAGNDMFFPDIHIWKYKTLEFVDNLMVERVFVSFEEMDPFTLRNNSNQCVTLYCTQIKIYRNSHGHTDVDTLRPVQSILDILGNMNQDIGDIGCVPFPNVILQDCVNVFDITNLNPEPRRYLEDFPSESFPDASQIYQMVGEAEPKDRPGWISAIRSYQDWLDRHTLLYGTKAFSSSELRKFIHPSFNSRGFSLVTERMQNNDTRSVNDMDIVFNESVTGDLMELVRFLSTYPFSDIRCTVQGYRGTLDYEFHNWFPQISARHSGCDIFNYILQNIRSKIYGNDPSVDVVMNLNWLDELTIKFYYKSTLIKEMFIDIPVWGGIGTHLLSEA